MKKVQIIEEIKKSNRGGVGELGDKKLASIVQTVYEAIASNVASGEGKVVFPGLGTFVVRNVEKEVEGVKKAIQKVAFRPAKSKAPGEKKARKENKEKKAGGAAGADKGGTTPTAK